MWVSVVGVPVDARLSALACVTARGKCFARVYEIKPDGLPPKTRGFSPPDPYQVRLTWQSALRAGAQVEVGLAWGASGKGKPVSDRRR